MAPLPIPLGPLGGLAGNSEDQVGKLKIIDKHRANCVGASSWNEIFESYFLVALLTFL